MAEIEKENTYLLKRLPLSLIKTWSKVMTVDIYYPDDAVNPQIRLRQQGQKYTLTKKYPLKESDLSSMVEETILLSEAEKLFLQTHLPGKKIAKNRYSKHFSDYKIDIDEYLDQLSPLVVLDIEWHNQRGDSDAIAQKFNPLQEITNSDVLAAGKIAGKSYDDIKKYF